MPRSCTVCHHPQQHEIDELLLAGSPFRNLSAQFQLSTAALHRHKHQHLGLLLVAAKASADEAAGGDVLESALHKLDAIEAEAKRLARVAERRGDLRTAAHLLVSEATNLVTLTARLKGLLQSGAQVMQVGVAVTAEPSPQAVAQAVAAFITGALSDNPPLRLAVGEHLRTQREQRLHVQMEVIKAERARLFEPPSLPIARPPADAEAPDGSWQLYLPPGRWR